MTLQKKTYKTVDILRLAFQASPPWVVIKIIFAVVTSIIPTTVMALVTANFVDTAIAILSEEQPRGDIYLPLIFLLAALAVQQSVYALSDLVNSRITLDIKNKIKPAVVTVHAALDFKHIENAESRELITRVSRDPVASVMDGLNGLTTMLGVVFSIAGVLGVIVAQVWWAAVVIMAFSVPMFWLSVRAGRVNYKAGRDSEKFNRRHEYLNEVLTGRDNIDERALFGYGEDVSRQFFEQYEAGRKLTLKVNLRSFLIIKGSSTILVITALLTALTLINPVVTGVLSAGMFMGVVAAFFGMTNRLGWYMSDSLEKMSRAGEYMKDLTAFVSLSEAEGALDEPEPEPIRFESLEFRDVSFKYPNSAVKTPGRSCPNPNSVPGQNAAEGAKLSAADNYILNKLSFKLEAGKHYAFVGVNGAGKTTVTKLLTGLYSEYEGGIFINGKELRTYPAKDLKAMFSVVYQDFAKYYIAMKDNIALGNIANIQTSARTAAPGIAQTATRTTAPGVVQAAVRTAASGIAPTATRTDAPDIAQAAALAGLDATIAELKDGINTPLGKILEGGQDISGGQWQRVAIARSIVSRAPVKMLDEPTAALDPVSESRIYSEFERLMRGKTTVFISHRLGSTKLADEILVIDGGKIAERGSHAELMARHGKYAEMFDSQRGWYL